MTGIKPPAIPGYRPFLSKLIAVGLLATLPGLLSLAGPARAESITGKVTRDGTNGIAGVRVNAYRVDYNLSSPSASALTDAGGNFTPIEALTVRAAALDADGELWLAAENEGQLGLWVEGSD